jgi:hypothetical protein
MEGHEQEGTGWFPPVTLLPAKCDPAVIRDLIGFSPPFQGGVAAKQPGWFVLTYHL